MSPAPPALAPSRTRCPWKGRARFPRPGGAVWVCRCAGMPWQRCSAAESDAASESPAGSLAAACQDGRPCVHSERSCLHWELTTTPTPPSSTARGSSLCFSPSPLFPRGALCGIQHPAFPTQHTPLSLQPNHQQFLPAQSHCSDPGKDWENLEQPAGRRRCPHTPQHALRTIHGQRPSAKTLEHIFFLRAARAYTLVLS